MKKMIAPKLTFAVGEKVVICGHRTTWRSGNEHYPNVDKFLFTTIKEVNSDGSVVVEEGYKYRQAYKTQYGETEVFDYFRIGQTPKNNNTVFYSPQYNKEFLQIYYKTNSFYGVTYLFKCDKTWENKVEEIKYLVDRKSKAEEEAKVRREAIVARKSVFLDAFHKLESEIKAEANAKLTKFWKENVCANCAKNSGGMCTEWNQEVATSDTYGCTAFDTVIERD